MLGRLDARQIVLVELQWKPGDTAVVFPSLRADKTGVVIIVCFAILLHLKSQWQCVKLSLYKKMLVETVSKFSASIQLNRTKQKHCLITTVHLSGLQTCLPARLPASIGPAAADYVHKPCQSVQMLCSKRNQVSGRTEREAKRKSKQLE